ncbi:MAG: hypothetical protein IJD13_02810 [Oscillospiraceae bacterium]|nr:hypothetical protein [Oscillospiraceae bacterium]
MKSGFARLDITPPFGARISGYFEERIADNIIAPLTANAVAFSDRRGNTAAVVSLDIIGIRQEEMDVIRRLAAEKNKIPYEAVFVACTHTHTGPEVSAGRLFKNDPAYNEYLFERISAAIGLAIADLKETKVEIARGKAEDIAFIRRYRMKDGSVKTNPGTDPNVVGPIGTPDETVQLVKLVREGAADIAIVNFQVHPDTVGGTGLCPDYPGYVRSTLEAALQEEKDGLGVHVVYFNGAQGDTNHVKIGFTKKKGPAHAQHMGRVIAGAVLSVYSYTTPVEGEWVDYGQKVAEVPSNRGTAEQVAAAKELVKFHDEDYENFSKVYPGMMGPTVLGEANTFIRHENGPDSFGLYLTCVTAGGIAFAGLPGEPFTDIGRGVKEGSPYVMTIPCCCANGYQGYFPTHDAYAEGGYEARSSSFKPGVAEILIDTAVSLTKEISERNTVKDIQPVRFYRQLDYAHIPYVSPSSPHGNIANNGCGVCSASMIAEYLTGKSFPVEDCAKAAKVCGAREGFGTDMCIFAPVFAHMVGLQTSSTTDPDEVLAFLESGKGMAIANTLGDREDWTGVFSDERHYVVCATAENGVVGIWDPMLSPGRYEKPGRKGKVRLDGYTAYADFSVIANDCKGRIWHLFWKD